MFRVLTLCLGFFFAVSAQAGYFVTIYGNKSFESRKPTHFVVAGNGSELLTLFQYAAASKAIKLQELYPQDQVVFITYNQSPGSSKNRLQIQSWGFKVLADKSKLIFSSRRLIQEFLQASKIASIDLYNHNSALYGSSLEDGSNPISQNTREITQIKSHLTSTSFIMIHGCNSGFYFAPTWSRLLGVPVAGSFTSTKFERLHSSGLFYSYQDDLMPKSGSWTDRNRLSFASSADCHGAGCVRMKPDYWPYTGMWGDYNSGGGLPFFKFFCVNLSQSRCTKAMAESVFGLISSKDYSFSSSYADYKTLVKDFLCPINPNSNIRKDCSAALDRAEAGGNRSYNPFQGKLLKCTFNGCYADIQCGSDWRGNLVGKSCELQNDYASSTAFVDEYLAYLTGFQYLNKSVSSSIFDIQF